MSAALFQSTHPVRGATHHLDGGFRARPISIHAPREGCDESTVILELSSGFQSTHPVRGATHPCDGVVRAWLISIHAPREGCDWFHHLNKSAG